MVRAMPPLVLLPLIITCGFLRGVIVTARTELINNVWVTSDLEQGTEEYIYNLRSSGSLTIIVEPCEGCVEVTVNYDSKQLGQQFSSDQGQLTALQSPGMERALRKGFYEFSSANASAGAYTVFVERYRGCSSELSYRIMVSTNIRAFGRPLLPPNDTLRVLNTTHSSLTVAWDPLLSPKDHHYCVYTWNIGGTLPTETELPRDNVLHPDLEVSIGSACGITDNGEKHITERLAGCSIKNSFTVSYDLETGANYIIEVLAYGASDDKTTSYKPLQTRLGGIYSAGLIVVPSWFVLSVIALIVLMLPIN